MKKVTVLGFYHKANVGDESYKLAFPTIFPNYEFQFTDKLTPTIIANTDAIIVGGGDILSDPFLDQIASVKKPKHVISASATEKTDVDKLKDFKNVIVRDVDSIEILKSKGINAKYAPDVAFVLKPNKDNGKKLIKQEFVNQKRELYEKVVVVVLNGYLVDSSPSGYDVRKFIDFQNFTYNLAHIADFTSASFVFLPFGQSLPWDDRVPNSWVAQKCKFWKKNVIVWNESNVQNTMDIIGSADAVISTRLHSTIFSIAAEVPFIDITHNHKNKSLLKTLDKQAYSVPYGSFDVDKTLNFLKFLLGQDDSKKEFKQIIDKQRELLGGLSDVCLC